MFVKWLDAGGPTVESDIQPLKLRDLEATGVLQWYNVGFKLDKVGPHHPLKNNKRPAFSFARGACRMREAQTRRVHKVKCEVWITPASSSPTPPRLACRW